MITSFLVFVVPVGAWLALPERRNPRISPWPISIVRLPAVREGVWVGRWSGEDDLPISTMLCLFWATFPWARTISDYCHILFVMVLLGARLSLSEWRET